MYNHEPSNKVGAPYMLIEYIHGTTAIELRPIRDSAPSMYGMAEQDHKFRRQTPEIQAHMLAFQFPKIGSLYYNEDTENFYIGPDIVTGKGPWTSSADYYRDLTDHLVRDAVAIHFKSPERSKDFVAPVLLNHHMRIHGQDSSGQYRLINRDFGAHNTLVDSDFNIVGVIDFDGVSPVPPEAAAQYPWLSLLSIEPPGAVSTNPYALERIEEARPQFAKYKKWLMEYEAAWIPRGTYIRRL